MTLGTSTARDIRRATALTLLTPLAQHSQAPPSGFAPSPPHVNAPPAEIKRMPGDGNGACKTGKYRDLFAEQGHPAAETKARLEKAFQQRQRQLPHLGTEVKTTQPFLSLHPEQGAVVG